MAEASVNRLTTATATGNQRETEKILKSNIDVNARNNFGRTALQVVKLGCPDVAKALLLAGADPNVRDSVLGLTVTHDAAREGYVDMLYVLVQNGADVNLQDHHGNLPLHLAACEGHLNAVEFLTPCTAQPFLTNRNGLTPLQLASEHHHHTTADWLQRYLHVHTQSE